MRCHLLINSYLLQSMLALSKGVKPWKFMFETMFFRIISITIIIFIDYQIIMTKQKEWEKARIK